MWKSIVLSAIAVAIFVSFVPAAAHAQETAPAAAAKPSPYSSLLGEVTAIDPGGKQITLKPDTGAVSEVALDDKTHFMKIAPGEKDLKKATDVKFSEIGVGDRVLARVRKLPEGTVSPATTVIVMTKAAITQNQEREQTEWQTRGIVGTVTLVNPATKEVTVKTQGADGKTIAVEPSDKVRVRKYAPNSVKFSDAVPSTVADIKTGDTIRVLGTKSEDGSRVTPEQIVFGTIVRQAGTILAIDPAAGTVKMTDLATKKPVVVKVNESTTLKRLPATMATMMAASQNGGGRPGGMPGGAGGPEGGAQRPEGRAVRPAGAPGTGMGPGGPGGAGPGGAGPGGPGAGGMGGRRFDPAKILDRVPSITLAELKVGDAIIISSSGGPEPTAISMVAGVEPLLTAPSKGGQSAGPSTSWNFEMSIPQ